jgi:phosphoglucosamine mutase
MAACMEALPQVLVGGRVAAKPDLDGIPEVVRVRQDIEQRLGDTGRLLVRYSGTEPLVRVMAEGPDEARVRALAQEMLDAVLKHANAPERVA